MLEGVLKPIIYKLFHTFIFFFNFSYGSKNTDNKKNIFQYEIIYFIICYLFYFLRSGGVEILHYYNLDVYV